MEPQQGSVGQSGFVERHGLWPDDRRKTAREVSERVKRDGIQVIRLSFADQHGILRGKSVVTAELEAALNNGCSMTSTLLLKDTSHRTVYPVWRAGAGLGEQDLTGGADFLMVPDPTTFRVLPWLENTGWMLCDIYFPDGRPVPFSTRHIGLDAVSRLDDAGYNYVSGLEVEFHVLKLEDPNLRPGQAGQPADPPEVSLLAHGFQYLTETRLDELEPVLDLVRRNAEALGLPVRTVEAEFGPSQCEMTFSPVSGMGSADNMVLFRSMVKQVCRRHGYHATFMCRPHVKDLFSSGWHLHQSLLNKTSGENAFTPDGADDLLSPTGRHFLAGLLEHAEAACVFTTPTINGYKRYRPYALAPDRILWGDDNRGAMLRVIGGVGDPGTRIENRVGEPAANPYLYLASQILCGLDGMARKLEPDSPSASPYEEEAPRLPHSLIDALDALRDSTFFRDALGGDFIDYMLTLKNAEVSRFLTEVTDWEQREYFEIF